MSFNDMTNEQVVSRYGGTTWQRIQDRYLVAAGSNHTVDTTGGSSTITLTENNLPSHSHSYINTIVGSTTLTTSQMPSHTHIPFNSGTEQRIISSGSGYGSANISTGGGGFASTVLNSTGGGGSHTHPDTSRTRTTDATGSGTAFSIEPPYIAIYMWRRTA